MVCYVVTIVASTSLTYIQRQTLTCGYYCLMTASSSIYLELHFMYTKNQVCFKIETLKIETTSTSLDLKTIWTNPKSNAERQIPH